MTRHLRRILFGTIISLVLAGCSPRIVETVRIEYRDRIQVDTTFVHDSTFVKEYIKGDTVRITEYKDRYVYQYKYVRDTLAVHDTTAVEHIKEVKVEQPISGWKRAKIGAFWWLVAAISGLLVWTFRKPIMKLIKLII